ncbi:hypothetical protein H5410_028003 [Solanum commersonii]|uniref:Uncharacterized protein n=1 Tax=Solanum commersonii TaxID=4109 RepID=A0A9J5Z3Q6_SOLCO|nr:hypothetical protein H5410_028003 [Solanum commersonii]
MTHEADVEVKINAQVIPKRGNFKYLESIIQGDGEIKDDDTYRIGARSKKQRLAPGVLCDKNVSIRLKDKFYKVVVRPTLLYAAKCWQSITPMFER